MHSPFRNVIYPILLGIVMAAVPAVTSAQCGGIMGLDGVTSVSGNPFHAEILQTFIFHENATAHSTRQLTQQVARDTQGRVRIDRSGGKFKVQAGSDEGMQEEQHHISICDPVAQQWILLDTLNKTATTQKMGFGSGSLLRSGTSPTGNTSFCSRLSRLRASIPGVELQDLGHKLIDGVDAEGLQEKRTFPSITNGEATTHVTVIETWCSEELGAVVLRTSGTEGKGTTTTTTMTNIQRGEPDATLFQIPPDYRVVEKVDEPGVHTSIGVIGGFSTLAPIEQPAPAAKP